VFAPLIHATPFSRSSISEFRTAAMAIYLCY
jgi:hypothetical protein